MSERTDLGTWRARGETVEGMNQRHDAAVPEPKRAALPEVLTVDQAAALLQLSPKTVKRLAGKGRVPGRRVGNQWRFGRQPLMEWVAGRETLSGSSSDSS
jgi:excisionase family DNA binding protein